MKETEVRTGLREISESEVNPTSQTVAERILEILLGYRKDRGCDIHLPFVEGGSSLFG